MVADYFSFTRKERLGVVMMLVVISAAIFLPLFFSDPGSASIVLADSSLLAAVSTIDRKTGPESRKRGNSNRDNKTFPANGLSTHETEQPNGGELFYFDPNTLSTAGWERLGVSKRAAGTIQKYIARGGRFRRPEDLGRIYGLPEGMYQRLMPYIRIARDTLQRTTDREVRPVYASRWPSKLTAGEQIDINNADTSDFIRLPGIGSKLAARIISFRSKLGGFYKVEQVGETFGLPDSTFQKIRVFLRLENAVVRKIDINNATVDEMKRHPYFKYEIANAIVLFRNEHGAYSAPADLKKVMAINNDVFEKIIRYVECR